MDTTVEVSRITPQTKNWKERDVREEFMGYSLATYWAQKLSEVVHKPEDGFHAHVRDIALADVVIVEEGCEAHPGVFHPENHPLPGN